jgi:transcriptional regulator with GAF, ATPase, and Fis domain
MTMVRQVAPRNVPVLLMGESGVGKEVIANVLHGFSPRNNGPLIKVNCGAIPDTLVDSELFGHEKGAFTGATTQKRGRFERAQHGTIFLDEIGELPLAAQVRLLRVLQEKEIERVGGTSTIPVDIRIIAATHRDLEEMVRAGAFRHDLWFRLNVFPIRIPPLRERKQDIPIFVQYFIERKRMEMKLHSIPPLAPKAISQLTAYDWPGNVRELHNVIERALIRNQDGPLDFDDLTGTPSKQQTAELPTPDTTPQELLTLDEMTSRYIRQVLHLTQGKINGPGGAAELLDINPNTLRRRLDKLGIPYGRKEKQRF